MNKINGLTELKFHKIIRKKFKPFEDKPWKHCINLIVKHKKSHLHFRLKEVPNPFRIRKFRSSLADSIENLKSESTAATSQSSEKTVRSHCSLIIRRGQVSIRCRIIPKLVFPETEIKNIRFRLRTGNLWPVLSRLGVWGLEFFLPKSG